MKTRIILTNVVAVLAVIAWSCGPDDGLDPNIVPAERSLRLFTMADKATIIDLRIVARNIERVDLTGSTITYPEFQDKRYLRYKDCLSNPTEFSFGVVHTNNSKTQVNVALVRQDSKAGAFREASITNKEVLVVNLLNNPEFIGYDPYSKSRITVMTNKPGDINYNNSSVVLQGACGQPFGNTAMLTYAPPAGFVGQVRFRYYVSVNLEGGEQTPSICNTSDYTDYHSEHTVVINVSN